MITIDESVSNRASTSRNEEVDSVSTTEKLNNGNLEGSGKKGREVGEMRTEIEMGSAEEIMCSTNDVRFLMLPASPQMKILGEDNDLIVDEFVRRMKAE